MAVLRMSPAGKAESGPGECFLLYTTPPEYGNVAEIYHSGLTVQFLLSKLEKRGSSEHPNIFQYSTRRRALQRWFLFGPFHWVPERKARANSP